MEEELVLIARVRHAHGIKGELLLESFTSDEARFSELERVFIRGPKSDLRELHIESVRGSYNGVLIKFVEISDRTLAQELHGAELLIPLSERPELPDGGMYIDEIIGMVAVDDETSEKVGVVTNVLEMPAGNVLAIRKNMGEEHLVTTRGEEIKKIDREKKEIRVKLLEAYGA